MAAALNTGGQPKQYDTREPIADLKRLIDSHPKLGFAFKMAVEKVKSGELTAEDLIAKLSERKVSLRKASKQRGPGFSGDRENAEG